MSSWGLFLALKLLELHYHAIEVGPHTECRLCPYRDHAGRDSARQLTCRTRMPQCVRVPFSLTVYSGFSIAPRASVEHLDPYLHCSGI